MKCSSGNAVGCASLIEVGVDVDTGVSSGILVELGVSVGVLEEAITGIKGKKGVFESIKGICCVGCGIFGISIALSAILIDDRIQEVTKNKVTVTRRIISFRKIINLIISG